MSRRATAMGRDDGSTIPLITGFFVLGAVVVLGGVAASDAFVDQRQVQSTCDGAALAAANSVDLGSLRTAGATGTAGDRLPLAAVQSAAVAYLDRDADRDSTEVDAAVSPDGRRVQLVCAQVRPVAFGALFGFAGGVRHVVQSTAATSVAADDGR